jgi:hypothetical protein
LLDHLLQNGLTVPLKLDPEWIRCAKILGSGVDRVRGQPLATSQPIAIELLGAALPGTGLGTFLATCVSCLNPSRKARASAGAKLDHIWSANIPREAHFVERLSSDNAIALQLAQMLVNLRVIGMVRIPSRERRLHWCQRIRFPFSPNHRQLTGQWFAFG